MRHAWDSLSGAMHVSLALRHQSGATGRPAGGPAGATRSGGPAGAADGAGAAGRAAALAGAAPGRASWHRGQPGIHRAGADGVAGVARVAAGVAVPVAVRARGDALALAAAAGQIG